MNKKRGYYTVNIGGGDRVMRFNMNFWAEFCDTLNIKLEQIGEVFDGGVSLSAIRAIVYSGLITFDRENAKQIDYNIYTVGSWLDDMDAAELENIVNAMMQSRILGNDLNMGIQRSGEKAEKKTPVKQAPKKE
jgi:hypothetical protein